MATRSTMSSGRWLSGIALCVLVGLSVIDAVIADGPPLNIVYIFADDLGWTDMSGPNLGPHTSDYYETPNLNKLAGQGMRFTNAYANPNCTPSRASLLTGRYAASLHLTSINDGGAKRKLLREPSLKYPLAQEEVTIANRFQAAGYATGLFGKWHLSHSSMEIKDSAQKGFDTFIRRKDLPKQGDWDHHRVEQLTDKAIQFIEQNKDQPFFMLLAHKAVHVPPTTRPDLLTKYENKPPGTHHHVPEYAGLVEQLDASVGTVVAKIDELGLTDNTLIVFSSDNGGAETSTSNNPLRGGKGQLFEGGIRVPTIIRMPGVIDAGSVTDTPIIVPDYAPTILDLAGIDQTNSNQNDGESLVPLLTNAGDLQRQSIFWHYPHYGRKGMTPVGAIRQGDWKLLEFFENGQLELYNVTVDPGEQQNLAGSLPQKAAALHAALKMWQEQVGADMPTINPNWQASQYAGKLKWVWDGGDAGDKSQERWKTTIHPDKMKTKSWIFNANSQVGDGPNLVPVSTHYRAFPTHAYEFDGADDGMSFKGDFSISSMNDLDDSAAFEIWFKLSQLRGAGQILFETGNKNQGLSMTIGNANAGDQDGNDDDLHLRVRGGGESAIITVDLSQYADPSRDFMQVVAVTKDFSLRNKVALYLNGARFAQLDRGISGLDWDSKRGGGLGLANGQVGAIGGSEPPPFSLNAFDGQIAMFRFYKQPLTDEQVLALYNYALGPTDYHIASAVGNVEIPGARPGSIEAGDRERNAILMFHERQTTLTDDLHVDLLASAIGATIGNESTQDTGSGLIAAGTEINSYFLHFDPVGDPTDPVNATVTIRFDDEILGIISTTDSLNTSNFILGVIGKYSKADWRGLELSPLDGVMLFDNNRSLIVNLAAVGQDFDHLRLITAVSVVPLPASWQMGLALLIACAVVSKFRKNTRC